MTPPPSLQNDSCLNISCLYLAKLIPVEKYGDTEEPTVKLPGRGGSKKKQQSIYPKVDAQMNNSQLMHRVQEKSQSKKNPPNCQRFMLLHHQFLHITCWMILEIKIFPNSKHGFDVSPSVQWTLKGRTPFILISFPLKFSKYFPQKNHQSYIDF